MNKKYILIMVILIAIIGGIYFLNTKNKNSAGNIVNFYCQEGILKTQFGKNYIAIYFNDGKNILLPQTISGSGIRYELGSTTFIGEGDNALLTEGTTTYTNCIAGNIVTKKETNNYTDLSKTFSFSYPNQFVLSGGGFGYSQDWSQNTANLGLLLAMVNIPKSFMTGTNFGESKFTVGTSADPDAVKNCLINNYGSMGTTSEVMINDRKFTKMNFTGAGAGNYYETTSYRTILNDQCYAIEYTIHSMNIYNYPTEFGIKEFDKVKITSLFEDMVQSFKFI